MNTSEIPFINFHIVRTEELEKKHTKQSSRIQYAEKLTDTLDRSVKIAHSTFLSQYINKNLETVFMNELRWKQNQQADIFNSIQLNIL